MMKKAIRTFLFLLTAISPFPAHAEGTKTPFTQKDASYIDIDRPEDLIQVPGTSWIIVSSMKSPDGKGGRLYAVNAADTGSKPKLLYPHPEARMGDTLLDPACRGTPDLAAFNPHGIALWRDDAGMTLFVVHHGARESIERFTLTVDETPSLTWAGCAVLPPGTWANAVAALGRSDVLVTSMFNTGTNFIERFDKREPTGQVWRWRNGNWTPAFPDLFSGANGIEVSPDGRWAFVSEWAARKVHRFALTGIPDHRSVPVDFLPDNLHWMENGTITLSGQKTEPSRLFACDKPGKGPCPPPYVTVLIAPETMAMKRLVEGGDEKFGAGTGTILIGDELWVGTVINNRIARFKINP